MRLLRGSVSIDTCTKHVFGFFAAFGSLAYTIKAKAKASDSYIARLTGTKPDQPHFTIIRSGS